MIRTAIANSFIGFGRSLGKLLGLQLVVEVSDHSIEASMQSPDKDTRAWDDGLYKSGQVFVSGYANPIKPRVVHHDGIDNPDHVDVTEGDGDPPEDSEDGVSQEAEDGEDDEGEHVQLISSGRYQQYMMQDLIAQLLTPETRWTKMLYGLLLIGVLQFVTIITVLYATGGF